MTTILATEVASRTLVAVHGSPPYRRGNCFRVLAEDGNEYKIVNFVYENLELLLKHGLTWPLKISILGGRAAILHDERIPDEWYSTIYCEVCCPSSLLPHPQLARHQRQEARGERIVGDGFVSFKKSVQSPLTADVICEHAS